MLAYDCRIHDKVGWIFIAPCNVLCLVVIMTADLGPPDYVMLSFWNMICHVLVITMPMYVNDVWILNLIFSWCATHLRLVQWPANWAKHLVPASKHPQEYYTGNHAICLRYLAKFSGSGRKLPFPVWQQPPLVFDHSRSLKEYPFLSSCRSFNW